MASVQKSTAKLVQVLLWYDEPQIVLLEINRFEYVIGLACEVPGASFPFIGASVSLRQMFEYHQQKIDLRYLYLHADRRRWWTFDLDSDSKQIDIHRVSGSHPLVDKNAPDTGFFSRDHDPITSLSMIVDTTSHIFNIDGSWDIGDFSRFYGQIEDIYYFFHSIDEYKRADISTRKRQRIQEAMLRPFKGGGSYVGLYNDFANDNDIAARLRVSGIKYNSPGYVEIQALERPFERMMSVVNFFSNDISDVKKAYSALYAVLSTNKLLKSDPRTYLSKDTRDLIEIKSKALCSDLVVINYQEILEMSDGNPLVSAKVILSFYRRVERLYDFFAQGRAQYNSSIT